MSTLIFPVLKRGIPRSLPWSLTSNTQTFSSPLTGSEQTTELPGAKWQTTISLNDLDEDDSTLLQAFLLRMRGKAGRVYLTNLGRPVPRGIATGTPLIKGAAQIGNALITDGWTPSISGILKTGDFFSVNDEMKMVVSDASSDISGNATLQFEPPLRSSPADNSSITLVYPTTIFRLTKDSADWISAPQKRTSFSLSFVESWP